MTRLTARDVIDAVLDRGSTVSWDQPIDISDVSGDYRQQLESAAARSGCDESVLSGRGTVHGRPVAFVVSEFRFLAGSIGRHAADRIVAAVRRATDEGLPLLASTASGGTRMQEGTAAFVRMIDISRAIMDHRTAGLPYLVHLRHPTTGGVFASWGSLGHVTIAEPGALVGFLGPKVYELLEGRPFPADVQTAENLAHRGVIDAVVPPEELGSVVDRTLGILLDPAVKAALPRRGAWNATGTSDAWDSINRTRNPGRAGARDVLRHGCSDVMRLEGTGEGERDNTIILALARMDGQPCVVIAQDRSTQDGSHRLGPAALREARRAMDLADELGLPLVSFIDTPGADLSVEAENGALGSEIARSIGRMSSMRVPTVSVLLGQGCGGGALALLPADVTIATEHAWLSPLPPEGASAIVYGDVEHAQELAEAQGVSAVRLFENGIVHKLVAEHDGEDARDLAVAVSAEVGAVIADLGSTRQSAAAPQPRAGRSAQHAAITA